MIPSYNLSDQVAQLQSQLAQMGQFQPQQYTLQPYMVQPQPVQHVMREEIKRVNGIDGAKEYQKNLAPNSNAVVFDNNTDRFYLVMKDANGMSPEQMTYGDFTLGKENSEEITYVTKDDFNKAIEEIKKLIGGNK